MPDETQAGNYSANCDVVRVSVLNHKPVLTIRCPAGPSASYPGAFAAEELTSSNLGRSWENESPVEPVAFSAVLAGRFLMAASTKSDVQYARLSDAGIYLRSEDHGKSWSMPAFAINGESRESFLLKMGEGKGRTMEFELLAIHGSPKHLFARLANTPWATLIGIVGSLKVIEIPELMESLDGGENWRQAKNFPPGVTAMGVSANDANLIYVNTKNGVFKSEDDGLNWALVGQNEFLITQPLLAGDQNPEARNTAASIPFRVTQFVIDPQDSRTVYMVTNKGFYRTLDGGNTWCLLNLGFDELDSSNSMSLNPERTKEVFLGTRRGIYFSRDGGLTVNLIYPKH